MLLCAFFVRKRLYEMWLWSFFGATILSHTYTNTCHKSIHMFGKSLDPYAKADWFEHGLILNWVVPHIEWHFNESVHPLATPSTNYCIHSHYPQTCSSTPSLHINCTLLGFRASWHIIAAQYFMQILCMYSWINNFCGTVWSKYAPLTF